MSAFDGVGDPCISLRPGLITKEAEKRVNSGINTWMRTPFGVVGAYILFQVALYKSLGFGEIVSVLTVAGLVLWNSIYYGRRVVENYGGETPRRAMAHSPCVSSPWLVPWGASAALRSSAHSQ